MVLLCPLSIFSLIVGLNNKIVKLLTTQVKGSVLSNNPNLNQPASGQPSVFGAPPSGGFGQSPNIAGQLGMINFTTPTYYVQALNAGNRLHSVGELQQMAKAKIIKSETLVQHMNSNYPVQVKTVPGVFSNREWIVTMLLSFTLGAFGVDRFYLGYTGMGIGKLLTFGGCGIWALIDFILIAMRSVDDSDGLPLS